MYEIVFFDKALKKNAVKKKKKRNASCKPRFTRRRVLWRSCRVYRQRRRLLRPRVSCGVSETLLQDLGSAARQMRFLREQYLTPCAFVHVRIRIQRAPFVYVCVYHEGGTNRHSAIRGICYRNLPRRFRPYVPRDSLTFKWLSSRHYSFIVLTSTSITPE